MSLNSTLHAIFDADLHRAFPVSGGDINEAFCLTLTGWYRDNYIGASPQINTPHDSWVAFYRDCRLVLQFRQARHCFESLYLTERKVEAQP